MYDDNLKDTIVSNLESKAISICNTALALASQGYLINKSKYIRLDWSSVLLNAFENIHVLSDEQQSKLEQVYNKLNNI